MKYLKLFEQQHKYSSNLYYESQLDEIIKKDWKELSASRDFLKFETTDYVYTVIFEGSCDENEIFLEETAIPKFIEKFKKEFMKDPEKYSQNFNVTRFRRDPKFMGDLSHFRETEKYNM